MSCFCGWIRCHYRLQFRNRFRYPCCLLSRHSRRCRLYSGKFEMANNLFVLTFHILTASFPVLRKDFNPVTCDGDCQYDNSCLAEAAGASNCVGSCPAPDTTVACPAVFAPVACGGTQWCLYDNLCTALAAGQEEIDCVRDCPTNTQEGVACTFEYDPGKYAQGGFVVEPRLLRFSNMFDCCLLQYFVVVAFIPTRVRRQLLGSHLPDCLKAAALLLALFLSLPTPVRLFPMQLRALPITTPR